MSYSHLTTEQRHRLYQLHNLDISPAQFKEVIPSLIRRCLIEKLSNIEGATFQVNSIFKAYISMLNNS
ncbi:MAG TPA: hypothetical protein V6C58_03845 [Allocoleopsis sp.]